MLPSLAAAQFLSSWELTHLGIPLVAIYPRAYATMLAGNQLGISSHGSVLQIASGFQRPTQEGSSAGFQLQQLLGLQELLPVRCVGYLSETKLVGAGFDGEVCTSHDDCVHKLDLGGIQPPCHSVPGRILWDMHVCAWQRNKILPADTHPGMLRSCHYTLLSASLQQQYVECRCISGRSGQGASG